MLILFTAYITTLILLLKGALALLGASLAVLTFIALLVMLIVAGVRGFVAGVKQARTS